MITKSRQISLSINKALRDMFEDGGALGVPFEVCGETEMRDGYAPTFPYIFILNFGTLFQVEHLPTVIVQLTIYSIVIEMGGTALACDLNLHVFARDSGQSLDICDALRHITGITLYDFTDPDNPVAGVTCEIDDQDGMVWDESPHSIDDDDLALESSLRFWKTLSAQFLVIND